MRIQSLVGCCRVGRCGSGHRWSSLQRRDPIKVNLLLPLRFDAATEIFRQGDSTNWNADNSRRNCIVNRPSLVWFRRDLRLEDQPALNAAISRGGPIIPIYISETSDQTDWSPGAASRWWLHYSLGRLNRQLVSLGSTVVADQRNKSGSRFLESVLRTGEY